MTYSSGASPLRGRYLVRDPALYAMLRVSDALLEVMRPARSTSAIAPPRRLLLGVGGHMGDAVIATSIIQPLLRAFPGIELGIALPSWSAPVVRGHAALRWIHVIDHWKTSRAAQSLPARWNEHRRTQRAALDAIARVDYDTAVDLYPFFPNCAWLFWRAGIPTRLGYRSGGGGSLYTHATDWVDRSVHMAARHLELLSLLDPTAMRTTTPSGLRYDLPTSGPAPDVEAMLRQAGIDHADFVLLHPGVGAPQKAWPTSHWRELAARLAARGQRVVVTGAGAAEAEIARAICDGARGALNLCGQLDWSAFRVVIARARLAIGCDSVAMHLAAGSGVPCATIMAGMSDPTHWHPLGEQVELLTREVPCAPCFRGAGCAAMSCVRDVSVADVLSAADRLAALVPSTS